MGRRDLSSIKPKIQAHNQFLKQHLPMLSLRGRHEWITKRNGYVSLDTFDRWDRKDNQTVESDKSDRLDWTCPECQGELIIKEQDLVCRRCGVVHEHVQSRKVAVDLGIQIERYQPAPEFSFGHGLGTPTPESVLRLAVKHVRSSIPKEGKKHSSKSRRKKLKGKTRRKGKTEAYEEYGDVLALKPYVSGKDKDPKLNSILEHLSKRMRQIHGFDPTTDKDSQFGDLNELGKFLRQVRVALKGHRFSPKKTVDALLVILYGDKAREVIERPEKRLLCPRCRRERPYARDTNPGFLLCLKCGKQIPSEDARFKVSYCPIDPVYVATIQRLMPALPSPVPKSYTSPQLIGQAVAE